MYLSSSRVSILSFFFISTNIISVAFSFVRISTPLAFRSPTEIQVSRYGPPIDDAGDLNDKNKDVSRMEDEERERLKNQFRVVLSKTMLSIDDNPELLPRELAESVELIFSLRGYEGSEVISEVVEEAKLKGQSHFEKTVRTVELILSFAEDFVEEATQLDSQNKKLLGKIIRAMTADDKKKDLDKEELLDQLLEDERDNFTPGFLRHLDGECNRIANAPKVTPESARLMEILRIIQTRVLEEIGKDMGETAVVLGQLLGYEDENELAGVLDAGLTVRGNDFAQEMLSLTQEALEGFQKVPGGVDSELVERVTFIDNRLGNFLQANNLSP